MEKHLKLKGHILILCLFMLVFKSISAEDSIASDTSFGLFPDIIDAVFSVQEHPSFPSFSKLTSNYLLTGIMNLDELKVTDSSVTLPFRAGYFRAGKNPWMVSLTGFVQTYSSDNAVNGISDQTYQSVTGTETDGTSDYSWVSSECQNTYDYTTAFNVNGTVTFLKNFMPNLNAGASLTLNFARGDSDDVDTWVKDNMTTVERHYYDAAAGSPPPEQTLDYETTTTVWDPQKQGSVKLSLPVYYKTGGWGSYLNINGYYTGDKNDSGKTVYTSQPAGLGGDEISYDDIDSSVSDYVCSAGGGFSYTASLAPIIWTNEADETLISASFLYISNSADDYVSNSVTTAGTARSVSTSTAKEETSSVSVKTVSERDIPDTLQTGVGFGQTFYFSLAKDTCFAFKPDISFQYSKGPDTDEDGIETLEENVWTRKTTKTTIEQTSGSASSYTRTVVTTEDLNDETEADQTITVSFAIPTALKVRPDGCPFMLIFSSSAGVEFAYTFGKDQTSREKVTAETYTEDGTLSGKSVKYPSDYTDSSSWSKTSWTFLTKNSFSLGLQFPAGINLDVVLNLNNLLDFDNLTIQTVVPLP
jgi:hypothetical protein